MSADGWVTTTETVLVTVAYEVPVTLPADATPGARAGEAMVVFDHTERPDDEFPSEVVAFDARVTAPEPLRAVA